MIRPKSFLTILLLTSFDLTISTAQEIGQTNSIDAELERMEDMLGLSSDDAEKIQVAIERVAEEEAGPNQAIFSTNRSQFGQPCKSHGDAGFV